MGSNGTPDERLAEAAARIEAWHQSESGSRVATLAANARASGRRGSAPAASLVGSASEH